MSAADILHKNAAAERIAAAAESLLQRRLQRERSAERWEEMARQADETAQQTAVNAAGKIR